MNKKEWKQQGFPFFSCKYLRMMARRLEQNISILHVFWRVCNWGVAIQCISKVYYSSMYCLFTYTEKFKKSISIKPRHLFAATWRKVLPGKSEEKNQFHIIFELKYPRKILYMVDYANIHEYLFIFICAKIGKVISIRTCFIFSQLIFYHIWRRNVFHRTF